MVCFTPLLVIKKLIRSSRFMKLNIRKLSKKICHKEQNYKLNWGKFRVKINYWYAKISFSSDWSINKL